MEELVVEVLSANVLGRNEVREQLVQVSAVDEAEGGPQRVHADGAVRDRGGDVRDFGDGEGGLMRVYDDVVAALEDVGEKDDDGEGEGGDAVDPRPNRRRRARVFGCVCGCCLWLNWSTEWLNPGLCHMKTGN